TSIQRHTPLPPPSPAGMAGPHSQKSKKAKKSGLITTGISVQVLNATGYVPGIATTWANRLAKLGFQIVAVDTAYGIFDHTTVFWSSTGSKTAAIALANHYGWL